MNTTPGKQKRKPLILVSNDDGYDSPGILVLVKSLSSLADVVVVAPSTQQSAVGHAITVQMPLRARRIQKGRHFKGWAVDGTPADSVKLGVLSLLKQRPDMVVSGINHGMNTSVNIMYSGTVSAATEGAILGIPSIAISHASHSHDSDLRAAAAFAPIIVKGILARGLPAGTLLNVNVPDVPVEDIAGVAVTRQGRSSWDDRFDKRSDPNGNAYYWLVGTYVWDDHPLADDLALRKNMISVTPLHYSLTDDRLFDEMASWKFLSFNGRAHGPGKKQSPSH